VRGRVLRATAWVGLVVVLLAGCASSPDGSVADELQRQVVAVAEASADADYDQALALLDDVQSGLDEAVETDSVSAAKATSVQQSIDLVRADLEALLEPEPEPSPTPSITSTPVTETPAEPETPVTPGKPGKGNDKDSKPGKDKKKP